jgi:hypothetical protein
MSTIYRSVNENSDPQRDAMERVMNFMDSLTPATLPRATTTDAPMVFINGWGRWCAKFDTSLKKYYAFGDTLTEALNKLVDDPTIEPLRGTADHGKPCDHEKLTDDIDPAFGMQP